MQGIRFFGEASPLPGFSTETLDEALLFLNAHKQAIEVLFERQLTLAEFDRHCAALNGPPSAGFGLSVAMGDFLARKDHLPLFRYLNPASPGTVAVNATLASSQADELIERAMHAWNNGFTVLKVKVGKNTEAEFSALKTIRESLPDCRLRIDANGAWDAQQALRNLNRFYDLQIEFCEQPVRAADLKGLSDLSRQSPIPVAADESARTLQQIRSVIDRQAADILIIKPMLIGSISQFHAVTDLAAAAGIPVVVTSCLEAGPGRRASAHLAAGLEAQRYAHGLATGRLLRSDFFPSADPIENGYYYLPDSGLDLSGSVTS